jgi:hypothetical protein
VIGYDCVFLVLNTSKQLFIFNLEILERLIMKYKKIMLIALLLLAVLTIGAVSASDDVALDNVTASDDVDVIAEDGPGDNPGGDEDEYGAFYTDEEIITDEANDNYDPEAYVASMVVPNTTSSGAFVISTDAEDDTEEDVILFSAPIIVNCQASGPLMKIHKTLYVMCI